MANPLPLVALAINDLTVLDLETAGYAFGSPDPDYPASNLSALNPAKVAKSTATSDTLTITTSSSIIRAVALFNTNAATATVSDGSSTPSLLIPSSLDYDGQRLHGWTDLSAAPLGPVTTWQVALNAPGPDPVYIGHVALIVALSPLNLKYGLKVGRRRPGDVEHVTRLGTVLRYGAQIRVRYAQGMVDLEEDESFLKNLEAASRGGILPFVFIPDENENDAWLVRFAANDFSVTIPNYGIREVPIALEEMSSGPPNG